MPWPPATPSSSSRRSTRRPSVPGSPPPGGPPCPTARTSSRSSPATATPAPHCAARASTSWPSPAPAPTGKKVMAACAENLVPVLLELGGKDAMIVDDDADVVAAADAAVWGAMSNAGQTCIGIEIVYVTTAGTDPFVAEVTEQVRRLRPGSNDKATYGPMTMPSQGDVVRRHV